MGKQVYIFQKRQANKLIQNKLGYKQETQHKKKKNHERDDLLSAGRLSWAPVGMLIAW